MYLIIFVYIDTCHARTQGSCQRWFDTVYFVFSRPPSVYNKDVSFVVHALYSIYVFPISCGSLIPHGNPSYLLEDRPSINTLQNGNDPNHIYGCP